MLIEHYQFIEAHLEYIYSFIYGKKFFDGLEEVSDYSLTRLIREIQKIDSKRKTPALTPDDYERLETIRERRNFWVHNSYYDLTFDLKTGELNKPWEVERMEQDLKEAESMRKHLFEVQILLGKQNRVSVEAELRDIFAKLDKALPDVIVGIKHFK